MHVCACVHASVCVCVFSIESFPYLVPCKAQQAGSSGVPQDSLLTELLKLHVERLCGTFCLL